MDGQRFDRLAKDLAGGSNRRGFLKRIAGLAAGAAAVAVPVKAGATIDDYCSRDKDCNSYNHEVCDYGSCVCAYGYKDCNGTCIPEDDCCSDYDCGKNQVCSYGICECPTYDGYKVCDYEGTCVPEYGCCGDYDCYNGTCQYGVCQAAESEQPASNPPGDSGQNYSQRLAHTCNQKCVRAGRRKAKQNKQRLTSNGVRRMRNSCRRRCAANSR